MRPHVECIAEDDYIWHIAELPYGEGKARQRNLSVDEEDGSASMSVEFVEDWGRPGCFHHADAEYYVLEGELDLGGTKIGKGGYIHAAQGVAMPYLRAKAGTKLLHYREFGDWAFDVSDTDRAGARESLTVLDTGAMDWTPVLTPGPMAGLHIKLLHRNDETGFYTRLIWAETGWTDHRYAHHPVYEEAYTLTGSMDYNYGDLYPGTYFFRPAWVKHGHFTSHGPDGCVWLIRSDGDLTNFYTTHSEVHVHNEPENYDLETQGPIIAGIPVRSKRLGPWDGDGR